MSLKRKWLTLEEKINVSEDFAKTNSSRRQLAERYRRKYNSTRSSAGDDVTFEEFISYLTQTRGAGLNEHWQAIHSLCSPCTISYDFVGKYETLTADSDFLLRAIGASQVVFPAAPKMHTTSTHLSILCLNWPPPLEMHGHALSCQLPLTAKEIDSALTELQEDYVESECFLKNRFAQALAIKGTQQYHAFIPRSQSKILVKNVSMKSEACEVSKFPDKLKLADISALGFFPSLVNNGAISENFFRLGNYTVGFRMDRRLGAVGCFETKKALGCAIDKKTIAFHSDVYTFFAVFWMSRYRTRTEKENCLRRIV
uniref:Carbohydrate sulfotransferase n=1 Tax=Rhodnius prolixus TaxID=13249 RepID=T1H937_RHOPR